MLSFPEGLSRVVEVVGLDEDDLGRSCGLHECCGKHVRVNDVLLVRYAIKNVGESI